MLTGMAMVTVRTENAAVENAAVEYSTLKEEGVVVYGQYSGVGTEMD